MADTEPVVTWAQLKQLSTLFNEWVDQLRPSSTPPGSSDTVEAGVDSKRSRSTRCKKHDGGQDTDGGRVAGKKRKLSKASPFDHRTAQVLMDSGAINGTRHAPSEADRLNRRALNSTRLARLLNPSVEHTGGIPERISATIEHLTAVLIRRESIDLRTSLFSFLSIPLGVHKYQLVRRETLLADALKLFRRMICIPSCDINLIDNGFVHHFLLYPEEAQVSAPLFLMDVKPFWPMCRVLDILLTWAVVFPVVPQYMTMLLDVLRRIDLDVNGVNVWFEAALARRIRPSDLMHFRDMLAPLMDRAKQSHMLVRSILGGEQPPVDAHSTEVQILPPELVDVVVVEYLGWTCDTSTLPNIPVAYPPIDPTVPPVAVVAVDADETDDERDRSDGDEYPSNE